MDISPLVEKEGLRLLAFLDTEMRAQTEALMPAELDFPSTNCGQLMRETRRQMKERLLHIRESAAKLSSTCIETNLRQNRTELKKNMARLNGEKKGAGALVFASANTQSRRISNTITGIEQEKANRRK